MQLPLRRTGFRDRSLGTSQERARARVRRSQLDPERGEVVHDHAGRRSAALELEPGPLLKTSSPVMGSLHGGLFVWTSGGRPAVVRIYKWFPPHKLLGVAFHSLTREKLIAEREGKVVWSPSRAGIEFKRVPAAPRRPTPLPRDSARCAPWLRSSRRITQRRRSRELRLLTQPVYR